MLEADKALSNKDQPAFQKQAEFAVGQPIEPRIVIHCFANSASPFLSLSDLKQLIPFIRECMEFGLEEETDNIRFNFFNGVRRSKSVISPIVMSKRLNGRTERRERRTDWNGLRDNFISALFCTRNFIAVLLLSPLSE